MRTKTLDKTKILYLINKNKDIVHNFGVRRIGVFGSYIRNEQKEESDVDLLVEFTEGKKTYKNFYEFSSFIEKTLGKKVDVLTPESISPYLAPQIKKEVEYVQISN